MTELLFIEKKAIRKYTPKCNRCGYDENIAAIVVHHIDKNRENNKIDNLEVLCANCHAIEHWDEKNRTINFSCNMRKSKIPPIEELKEALSDKNRSGVAKKYNVSSTTITRWCRYYNLK